MFQRMPGFKGTFEVKREETKVDVGDEGRRRWLSRDSLECLLSLPVRGDGIGQREGHGVPCQRRTHHSDTSSVKSTTKCTHFVCDKESFKQEGVPKAETQSP